MSESNLCEGSGFRCNAPKDKGLYVHLRNHPSVYIVYSSPHLEGDCKLLDEVRIVTEGFCAEINSVLTLLQS